VISTYFTNTAELLNITAALKLYFAQGDQYLFEDESVAQHKDDKPKQLLRELSRLSYRNHGYRFVANSHNLAQAVGKRCGRKADSVLPVCTDQTIFRPLSRSLPGSLWRLLIVGPDSLGSPVEPLEFKGILDARKALEILSQRQRQFTAVRMSSSDPEIFRTFPCEFYRTPPEDLKTYLYGTADILIYASHYDSCPRPPQEAMASGAAVICTATAGAMEYCQHEVNCLLVRIKSPQAIAEAVERLMDDESLRQRIVQGGIETARQYPQEREWDEWEDYFTSF
jgi:glycosyltransferase involved in cell wall biosynthesis